MIRRNFNIFPGHNNPRSPSVESTEETFQMDERNVRNFVNDPWSKEDHFYFGIILISIFYCSKIKIHCQLPVRQVFSFDFVTVTDGGDSDPTKVLAALYDMMSCNV